MTTHDCRRCGATWRIDAKLDDFTIRRCFDCSDVLHVLPSAAHPAPAPEVTQVERVTDDDD